MGFSSIVFFFFLTLIYLVSSIGIGNSKRVHLWVFTSIRFLLPLYRYISSFVLFLSPCVQMKFPHMYDINLCT
ncbi:hypothetical protein F5Y08DRAFT_12794 [Xylaria arbuscula]|nr:hypothetical protein F5Y08DRAFT_12794 [Xylaria arbuscula]